MAPHRRTVSSTASCDEERVCDSHETREEGEKGSKKSGIAGDEGNIAILLFLYILQGIPLGLAAAVPLILTNRNVSYKQQAGFSFAYWPFSIKLLWAPIGGPFNVTQQGSRQDFSQGTLEKSWLPIILIKIVEILKKVVENHKNCGNLD